MKQRHNSARGFTLLEVLVATTIAGTAVAALLGLFSGTLGNIQRVEPSEQALMLGRSMLNELLAQTARNGANPPLPLGETVRDRWDNGYHWEARAERFRSSPEPMPGESILVQITLDVFWRSGAQQERKLSFETYQLWQEPPQVRP